PATYYIYTLSLHDALPIFDGAIAHLRTVLRTNPNHSKAYYSLAMALVQKGETNQAIAYYDRALKLEPDFPDAHCNLANLLLEKGDRKSTRLNSSHVAISYA